MSFFWGYILAYSFVKIPWQSGVVWLLDIKPHLPNDPAEQNFLISLDRYCRVRFGLTETVDIIFPLSFDYLSCAFDPIQALASTFQTCPVLRLVKLIIGQDLPPKGTAVSLGL